MKNAASLRCILLISVFILSVNSAQNKFPEDFFLGFATSSYQIEGAWNEDGKGESNMDFLTHFHPERFMGGNGDVAADSYHKYTEDVFMLKHLGAQMYRFSLSWPRILPTGDTDVINQAGIDYYNNLIDELLRNGVQPMVTLFHWDLPLALSTIGGWTNPKIQHYFEEYSKIAFTHFGDRVKWWFTFNEPSNFCLMGYGFNLDGNKTNSGEYSCAHNVLLSHARAYHLYDREFRSSQQGKIGIVLCTNWVEPKTDSAEDKESAENRLQFEIGWFAHPIFIGDYPPIMRQKVDGHNKEVSRAVSRLPIFDPDTLQYVKGTSDFLGANHYTTKLASAAPAEDHIMDWFVTTSWGKDNGIVLTYDILWPTASAKWLQNVPWGFRKLLNWFKNNYNNVTVIITENGYADRGELQDTDRINYYKAYIKEMLTAIHEDKCNVIGYLAWSLMDNFEWLDGYTTKFGVFHVDFESPERTRTPKASAEFFRKLYRTRELPDETDAK